jgi:hypothetical protein
MSNAHLRAVIGRLAAQDAERADGEGQAGTACILRDLAADLLLDHRTVKVVLSAAAGSALDELAEHHGLPPSDIAARLLERVLAAVSDETKGGRQ